MTTIEAISILNKVFKTKKWTEADLDEFVFDNFCVLLDNLNESQRSLVVELIERYCWISLSEYPERILKALEYVEDEKLNQLKTVYLFPIVKPKDEGKFKSAQFLMYQIKVFKRHLKKYTHIKFKFISKFKDLTTPSFSIKEGEALFLIDDYIGSGETFEECITEIKKNKNITNERINTVTIACQADTLDLLKEDGISCYTDFQSEKGISDSKPSSLVQEKIDIMLEIEKLIPGGSHVSLGYKESEALITLARTPDNTFPIFWKTYRVGMQKYDAPFSREETVEL
ncbi:MAG: hypothetical protein CL840_19770 [Crocinitomicaceae bacterium]|nr:hypothetical protein [Crocinitomicaceae bacterium]|tara:strand:- start:10941 stop:11795 length:855 start_codon:yes stop_codon:yes gene_type:complete